MPRITKKNLTDTLNDKGFILTPCIAKCNPGDLRLYNKDGKKYHATINLVGGKLSFNDQVYNDVEAMLSAIEQYNSTLEFDVDTYNPDYNTESVTEMRLNATIRKCGYKGSGYQYGTLNGCYAADSVLGFKFPPISGNAILLGGSSFIELYDKNDTDSVKSRGIMSMLGALYAANIANLAGKLADMGAIGTLSSLPIKTLNPDTLEITEQDGIDGVIEILKTALSKMKKAKKEQNKKD